MPAVPDARTHVPALPRSRTASRASRRQARMFTGIVAELGEVADIEQRGDAARLTIRASTEGVSPGESIAVNGVCLTVTGILDGTVHRGCHGGDPGPVQPGRAGLGSAGQPGAFGPPRRPPGRPSCAGPRGRHRHDHLAVACRALGSGPDQPARQHLALRGAQGIDRGRRDQPHGVRAGAAGGEDTWFEVCLIPETLKRTTMGTRQPGEVVNLEVDVIAKYVERLLNGEGRQ